MFTVERRWDGTRPSPGTVLLETQFSDIATQVALSCARHYQPENGTAMTRGLIEQGDHLIEIREDGKLVATVQAQPSQALVWKVVDA